MENGSLENVLRKFGKFPESLVGIYIAQVLQGLLYLHNQGVIHRDIKVHSLALPPYSLVVGHFLSLQFSMQAANILITKQGLVKVADFGVSTKLNEANDLANSTVMGSPYWSALLHSDGVLRRSPVSCAVQWHQRSSNCRVYRRNRIFGVWVAL